MSCVACEVLADLILASVPEGREMPPRLPIEKDPVVCLIVVAATFAGRWPDEAWTAPEARVLLKQSWRELWPRCSEVERRLAMEVMRHMAFKRFGKEPPARTEPAAPATLRRAARVVGA